MVSLEFFINIILPAAL